MQILAFLILAAIITTSLVINHREYRKDQRAAAMRRHPSNFKRSQA